MAEKMADHVAHAVEDIVHDAADAIVGPSLWNFGFPTLDKPFGVSVYPLFRKAVLTVTGRDTSHFHYEFNSSVPMSTVPEVTFAIITYYVLIFGGQWLLSKRPPIKLGLIFKAHNLLLTLFSLILLLLLVEQVLPMVVRNGIFYAICSPRAWTQKIELVYYLNYLTKYYEFFDTLFLVLKHRPLTFLHTYHHGATALLCFSQLNGLTSVSWVPISLNLFAHVVMYFYYFLSACGIRPWWKHWVTRIQILQFVIDLGFVYFASYTYFVSRYWPWLPNKGTCAGEESAALNGCLILSSYLVLFISFYIKVYYAPKKTQAPAAASAAAAATELATEPATAKTSGSSSSKKTTKSRRV